MDHISGLPPYAITRQGQVINTSTRKLLKPRLHNGYHAVSLCGKDWLVHRLVAMTYLPTDDTLMDVDHINGNVLDNRVDNLQWLPHGDNVRRTSKPIYHEHAVQQIDVTTKQTIKAFASITEAANALGVTRRAIQLVCNGQNKSCKGYSWAYVTKQHNRVIMDDTVESRQIVGFPRYMVFRDGRIYNTYTRRFLKPVRNAGGQHYVTLCRTEDGHVIKKNEYVNRLVARTFIQEVYDHAQMIAVHLDGNKTNNHANNLAWKVIAAKPDAI